MKKLLFLALVASQLTFAQTVQERFDKKYLEVDKAFDIDCKYSFNKTFKLLTPTEDTKKTYSTIERGFTLETSSEKVPMYFKLQRGAKGYEYQVKVDGKYLSSGSFGKRQFYISPLGDRGAEARFEASRIVCNVNFAYELPYTLVDGDYHINVHPHVEYDWQNLLKDTIESYLSDSRFKSMILLETGNYRGNLVNIDTFLDNRPYSLPQNGYKTRLENVPEDTLLLVSPAGHNRFLMDANAEVNVTFTGGNHNYCIWNNTREVLEGLMRSHSTAKVNVYYDASATVAQRRGIEGMSLDFPKADINKSNRLSDLLRTSKATQVYHLTYHNYFKNYFFNEFKGMFKEVKLKYSAVGFERNDLIEGTGTRKLEINLIYINQ